MNILLTGGAGYIGTHTCVELVQTGHSVVCVDNFVNSQPEVIDQVNAITGQVIPIYTIDVCDKLSLENIFQKHDVDVVIHFAGLKAVGESVQKPLTYYRNNLDATMTLCEVMTAHKVKKLVFSSSATVYGDAEQIPLVETIECKGCTNPYGWTKYMTEKILADVATADPDWSIALLRYFNPVGAHESGLIGENPKGIPNNLMPYITQVAARKLEKLSIFGGDYDTPDGTGVRDYIHVVDLAKGHVAACEFLKDHSGVEIFNLGTGIGYSVLDMVKTFEKVIEVSVPYQVIERRQGDVATCFADVSKAKSILGWTAEKSLDDMCRDSWRWQNGNITDKNCF